MKDLLLGVLLCCTAAGSAIASVKDYPFKVDTRASGKEYVLVAVNDGPATITLSALVKGTNVASDRNWPLVDVIPPHSTKKVARIFAASPGNGFQFNTRYSHAFGDAKATPDTNFSYRLPFADGTRSVVGQAPGGKITTHTAPESKFAIDFTLPEKTPVVAARDGTVIDAVGGFSKGGTDPALLEKANVVTVLHSDGTMASYVHLAPNSLQIKSGDEVKVGQVLAASGDTGYSSGPHLHFAVTKAIIRPNGLVAAESIPIGFVAFNPAIRFDAKQNLVAIADYKNPGHPEIDQTFQVAHIEPRPPVAVLDETDLRPDPDSLTIVAQEGAEFWLDEVERRTGYPWWAWIGSIVCSIALLWLYAAFRETLIVGTEPTTAD